jgi:hypothetical protein
MKLTIHIEDAEVRALLERTQRALGDLTPETPTGVGKTWGMWKNRGWGCYFMARDDDRGGSHPGSLALHDRVAPPGAQRSLAYSN